VNGGRARKGNYVVNSVPFEMVVALASVSVLLLAVAAWLPMIGTRATVIQSGPHFAQPTGIWKPKVIALTVLGFGITVLLMAGASHLPSHQFRQAEWDFAASALLIFAFFRHRRIALAIELIAWPLAMAGPIALVKPTPLGLAITLTEGAAFFVLLVCLAKKYPNATRGDLQKLFDRDPA
jgi:hypothetical protein